MQRKIQMVHGEYSTVGLTGQEQKESNRKEDFKQKKKQKNGMHVFCYNSLLIQL